MDDITIHSTDWKDVDETENKGSLSNIQYAEKDNFLIFMINKNAPLNTPSSTGKTMAIASTGGMIRLAGKLLNIWYGRKL